MAFENRFRQKYLFSDAHVITRVRDSNTTEIERF
jgi:hypothetical protein